MVVCVVCVVCEMEFSSDMRQKKQELSRMRIRQTTESTGKSTSARALDFGMSACTNSFKWKPGDVIPTGSVPNVYAPESPIPERECALPQPIVIDLLKCFEQNIIENLSRINGKLEAIDEKIKSIEERESLSTSTGTPVSSPLPHGKRRRKTPTTLQV